MLYCDYTSYAAYGGQMSEAQYAVWGPRASAKIDRLTFGRAETHASECSTALADACAQIADLLFATAKASAYSGYGVLASVTTDGESQSFSAAGTATATGVAYRILVDALGADPCGLLFAGVG